jgi:hypothetical protein
MQEKYPGISTYAYSLLNPIRFIDPNGKGPKDRIQAAYNMVGTKYLQETNSKLRTENTDEALEYMDCAEFVCRVLAADEITNGVKHLASSSLKSFLDNTENFEFSSDKPQIGDIAVWDGHVGIVTGVSEDGTKIKLTHARGKDKPAQENPYAIEPSKYRASTFYGYYRPINETEDGKVSAKNGAKSPSAQTTSKERIYNGGTLPEVVVKGKAPEKTTPQIPALSVPQIKPTDININN